jgi:hypothetical protein
VGHCEGEVIEGLDKKLDAPLELRDMGPERGHGVFAPQPIPKHSNICEYRSIQTRAQYQVFANIHLGCVAGGAEGENSVLAKEWKSGAPPHHS